MSWDAAARAINLLSLAVSLWLGFYILTRSPCSARSQLGALTVWSLDFYFVYNVLAADLPRNAFNAWLQQLVIVALPFALHLSVQLLPKPPRWLSPTPLDAVNRFSVPLAYVVGVLLVVGGAIPSDPAVNLLNPGDEAELEQGAWGQFSAHPGAFFPAYVVFLILGSLLTVVNLWQGRVRTRQTVRSRCFTLLFVAMALAGLGASYLGLGTWLGLALPTLPAEALVGASVMLVGYTVARHSALLEGRPSPPGNVVRDTRGWERGPGLEHRPA